jgi:hypothetical protein
VDEVQELAVSLLHRRHKVQEAQGVLLDAWVSGLLEVPQVDYSGTGCIVDCSKSLETIASGRSNRSIIWRFRVECHRPGRPSCHRHVETEVTQVVQVQIDWFRAGRNRDGWWTRPASQNHQGRYGDG